MSYGGYGSYGGHGGGSPGGYNANPFDDRNAAGYGSGAVEMASLGQGNNKSILEQCTELSNGIRDVENKLDMLDTLQKRILADTSGDSVAKQKLDSLEDEIMAQYRALTDQFRAIKSHPQSGQPRYAAQVGLVDRRLREANHKFQVLKSAFSKEMKGQMERQLRIIRPDASDVEIQKMVESGNSAVFQQALMQGNARLGMADDVLNNVNQRHRDLLRIEEQLVELLKLMELMEVELEKQDAMVAEIDAQAEAAAEEMVKANEELQTAVVTARKTRKKKWICLGICVTILLIIVIAVVAYILINRAANGGGALKKRSLFRRDVLDGLQMNTARAVEFAGDHPAASENFPQPEIDVASRLADADIAPPPGRFSKRRLERARIPAVVAPDVKDGAFAEKRFIVNWEGVDPTGADD